MGLQIGKAIGLVLKTRAYIYYRAAIYAAMCLATLVFLFFLAGVGAVFTPAAAFVLLIVVLAGGAILGVGRLIREYVLYLMKAGHVALIVEFACGDGPPKGVSQTAWAKERVLGLFKETSALAVVDQLVKGIVRAINRTLFRVANIVPIPGIENLAKAAEKIVDFSLTYVDEAILAHAFRTKNDNVFDAASSGVVLYCQSWKPLLKNAVALTLLGWVFGVVAAIVFLIPLGALALSLPADWASFKFMLFLAALFMGFSVKWILFDPIACASTLLTFLRETETMTPDPEWEARVAAATNKFQELKAMAAKRFEEMRASAGAAAAPASPPAAPPPAEEAPGA